MFRYTDVLVKNHHLSRFYNLPYRGHHIIRGETYAKGTKAQEQAKCVSFVEIVGASAR